ncbi:hypothetical protein LTS18_013340, partial [Coniosporium uncinatum]
AYAMCQSNNFEGPDFKDGRLSMAKSGAPQKAAVSFTDDATAEECCAFCAEESDCSVGVFLNGVCGLASYPECAAILGWQMTARYGGKNEAVVFNGNCGFFWEEPEL